MHPSALRRDTSTQNNPNDFNNSNSNLPPNSARVRDRNLNNLNSEKNEKGGKNQYWNGLVGFESSLNGSGVGNEHYNSNNSGNMSEFVNLQVLITP